MDSSLPNWPLVSEVCHTAQAYSSADQIIGGVDLQKVARSNTSSLQKSQQVKLVSTLSMYSSHAGSRSSDLRSQVVWRWQFSQSLCCWCHLVEELGAFLENVMIMANQAMVGEFWVVPNGPQWFGSFYPIHCHSIPKHSVFVLVEMPGPYYCRDCIVYSDRLKNCTPQCPSYVAETPALLPVLEERCFMDSFSWTKCIVPWLRKWKPEYLCYFWLCKHGSGLLWCFYWQAGLDKKLERSQTRIQDFTLWHFDPPFFTPAQLVMEPGQHYGPGILGYKISDHLNMLWWCHAVRMQRWKGYLTFSVDIPGLPLYFSCQCMGWYLAITVD